MEENVENFELCIVGKFRTEQSVNFKMGVTIKEIGHGRLLCQFFHTIDLKRVLNGDSLTFSNHPLLVYRLRLGENPLTVPLNIIPF